MKKRFELSGAPGQWFQGINGYHNTPRNGIEKMKTTAGYNVGIELEIEFNSGTPRNEFLTETDSNWFYCESDGSLNSNGVEIITIPISPVAAIKPETWRDLLSELSPVATSHNNGRCGLHVHIGREAFGATDDERDETVFKLLYLYYYELQEADLLRVFRRNHGSYCPTKRADLNDAVRTICEYMQRVSKKIDTDATSQKIKDIARGGDRCAINCRNNQTIEFRQGKGTLNIFSLLATIEFCIRLVEFSRKPITKMTRKNFLGYIEQKCHKNSPLKNKLLDCEL